MFSKSVFPTFGSHYEPCQLVKHCSIYPISNTHGFSSIFIVHSDVWSLVSITSLFGFKYFFIFVDDYSRAMWVYLLKRK